MIDLSNVTLIKNIGKYFCKSWSFKALQKKYSQFSKYELLAALYTYGFEFKEMKDLLPLDYIKGEEFIVISDTHIGSVYENLDYLNIVYDYAKENDIKTILHCGDIIQSTVRGCKSELVDQEKQVNYLMNIYPKVDDINTKFVLGNHDYHTVVYKNIDMFKIMAARKDFSPLGFKKVYLEWAGSLISMSHSIDDYKLILPDAVPLINFIGHRHSLKVADNNIYVPTLSDDLKLYADYVSKPGFLTVNKDGLAIVVCSKAIEHDKINDEGIILRKTVNPKSRIY